MVTLFIFNINSIIICNLSNNGSRTTVDPNLWRDMYSLIVSVCTSCITRIVDIIPSIIVSIHPVLIDGGHMCFLKLLERFNIDIALTKSNLQILCQGAVSCIIIRRHGKLNSLRQLLRSHIHLTSDKSISNGLNIRGIIGFSYQPLHFIVGIGCCMTPKNLRGVCVDIGPSIGIGEESSMYTENNLVTANGARTLVEGDIFQCIIWKNSRGGYKFSATCLLELECGTTLQIDALIVHTIVKESKVTIIGNEVPVVVSLFHSGGSILEGDADGIAFHFVIIREPFTDTNPGSR